MNITLNKKEKRLYDLIGKEGDSHPLGFYCKKLKTTPRTLLETTLPGLRRKLENRLELQGVTYERLAAGELSVGESGVIYGCST